MARSQEAREVVTAHLLPEQKEFLLEQVRKGRYKSISQAVARAVDLLKDVAARQDVIDRNPDLIRFVAEKAQAERAAAEKKR